MEPRLSTNRSYLAGDSAGLLPSVAQPPLPLQEFLPLQPLSPVLQPPLPLHEFMPLQACLSVASLSLSLSPILSETPAFELDWTACADTANEPLIKPAIAAPAIIAFLVILNLSFLCWFLAQLPNGTIPLGTRQSVKIPKAFQLCAAAPSSDAEGGEPFDMRLSICEGKIARWAEINRISHFVDDTFDAAGGRK